MGGVAFVLANFSPEEIMLIFVCLFCEINLVFVSQSLKSLSSAISFFTSILKPFRWPFPLIYSLPSKCLEFLESPLLFCYGIKMDDSIFEEKVFKSMQHNQTNQILFVYLDSFKVIPYEFKESDIWLPQFNDAWHQYLNQFSKLHGLKKSRSVELEKIKIKGKQDFLKFKFLKKIEKKATINKARPKQIADTQYYGRLSLSKNIYCFSSSWCQLT